VRGPLRRERNEEGSRIRKGTGLDRDDAQERAPLSRGQGDKQMEQTTNETDVIILIPTREQVENLKEGDLAIDCFGKMRKVTRICHRGVDIHGRAFVGYYTEHGTNGSISHGMKEDTLVRTVATSQRYTSAELDSMERLHRAARAAGAA
jgi:hypothetical protein